MVQGCLKLRETIDMIAHGDPFCDELILTANDWSAVDRVELFLRKPARLSTRIGSSSVGSISLAHNATKSMVDHCNTYMSDASSVIASAAEGMLATLVSKSQLFNSNPAVVARFLDIRCARDVLSDEYRCDELMVLQLLSSHRYQTPSEATTVSFVQPDVECGSVWSEDDDLFGAGRRRQSLHPTAKPSGLRLNPKPTNNSTLWHGVFRIVWSIHGSRCLLWTTCPSQPMVLQLLSSHRYQTPSEATTVSFVQPDVECGSVWSEDDDLFGAGRRRQSLHPTAKPSGLRLNPKPTNNSTLWHGVFRIVWSIHGSRCLLWTTCPSQRLLRQVKGRIPLQRLCSVDEIV